MRFIWFSAVLAAGCVGAPTGLKHTTRTTLNPVCTPQVPGAAETYANGSSLPRTVTW